MTTIADTPTLVPQNTVASYSDLALYSQCKRAWWLRTFRRLRLLDEPPTGALPFGSRVHMALEAYYDGTASSPVEAWSALMAHEYAVAEMNGNPFIDALDKESKLGHRMMEGYVEWLDAEGEDAYFDTVAVEQQLSSHLPLVVDTPDGDQEVTVLVRGKLDRQLRRKSDGALFIADFKTAANLSESTVFGLVNSPQPRIYRRLLKAHNPDSDVRGAVFTVLRKVMRTATAKPPFYRRITVEISETDQAAYDARLEGAVTDLVRTQYALEAGADPNRVAYFTTGWFCASCPFKLPCGLMQTSPQGAEDMLADLYTESDIWARYAGNGPQAPDDTEVASTF